MILRYDRGLEQNGSKKEVQQLKLAESGTHIA